KVSNSPEQSTVAPNDLSLDGAGFVSTKTNDEVDDDDPFSKRRYDY
ncbi:WRKY transcription factor, partial [Trifolium medium]|nr:WRKY transcription factor [Trifolium medium]